MRFSSWSTRFRWNRALKAHFTSWVYERTGRAVEAHFTSGVDERTGTGSVRNAKAH